MLSPLEAATPKEKRGGKRDLVEPVALLCQNGPLPGSELMRDGFGPLGRPS